MQLYNYQTRSFTDHGHESSNSQLFETCWNNVTRLGQQISVYSMYFYFINVYILQNIEY